jgi:peptide/nickel transport system substrate-binding protein
MIVAPDRHALLAVAVFATASFAISSAQTATPANAIVVALSIDDAVSFDLAEGFGLTTVHAFNNVYQRLVESNRKDRTKVVPAIAASWKASGNGKSLDFEIRKGAAFASGNPVRPEDVVFSLVRAIKLNKSPAFILNELGWTAQNVEGTISLVNNSYVRPSWTADVSLAFALALLTRPIASIVDKRLVSTHVTGRDIGNVWLQTNPPAPAPASLPSSSRKKPWFLRQMPRQQRNPSLPA